MRKEEAQTKKRGMELLSQGLSRQQVKDRLGVGKGTVASWEWEWLRTANKTKREVDGVY